MTTPDASETFEVYQSPGKLLVAAIGCAGFVLACIWLLTLTPDNEVQRFKIWFAAGLGIPFFGLGFFYLISRAIWRRPALVVDREGLWMWGTVLGPGRVRWDEIAAIDVCDMHRGNLSLAVKLIDERATLERIGRAARVLAKANRALTGYAFHVPESGLPMRAEELRTRVLEMWERFATDADQNGIDTPTM